MDAKLRRRLLNKVRSAVDEVQTDFAEGRIAQDHVGSAIESLADAVEALMILARSDAELENR